MNGFPTFSNTVAKIYLIYNVHFNFQVSAFTGASELAAALKDVDLVIIPAGVPRKPGMTRDDLFNINAGIVRSLIEAVADNAPNVRLLLLYLSCCFCIT